QAGSAAKANARSVRFLRAQTVALKSERRRTPPDHRQSHRAHDGIPDRNQQNRERQLAILKENAMQFLLLCCFGTPEPLLAAPWRDAPSSGGPASHAAIVSTWVTITPPIPLGSNFLGRDAPFWSANLPPVLSAVSC